MQGFSTKASLVREKLKFERFLPYMCMVAILVDGFLQSFIPLAQGGFRWNMIKDGPGPLEELFENVDRKVITITNHQPSAQEA